MRWMREPSRVNGRPFRFRAAKATTEKHRESSKTISLELTSRFNAAAAEQTRLDSVQSNERLPVLNGPLRTKLPIPCLNSSPSLPFNRSVVAMLQR